MFMIMMKKSFLAFLLLVVSLVMNAQTPDVSVAISNLGTTSFDATFTRNASCTHYCFIIDEPGSPNELSSWASMFGMTFQQAVEMFGLQCVGDTNFHYSGLPSNTLHVLYTVAYDANDVGVMRADTITTLSQGGTGQSVVTVTIGTITAQTAQIIATPNSETEYFMDGLIEKDYFDSIGFDSVKSIVMSSPYPQYETDDWIWSNLDPETAYYACAVGCNANNVWGPMDTVLFSTAAEGVGFELLEAATLAIYPNPTTDKFVLDGMPETGAVVTIYNVEGRVIMQRQCESVSASFDVSMLNRGIYFVRVMSGSVVATHKLVLK
ncbi:MAG: T9SS type A sorting domain-containing protein [Bacteroidales bacterium]|nr:T9SS type A sorting domain-containing protein [Bacteroidales bacterium]